LEISHKKAQREEFTKKIFQDKILKNLYYLGNFRYWLYGGQNWRIPKGAHKKGFEELWKVFIRRFLSGGDLLNSGVLRELCL